PLTHPLTRKRSIHLADLIDEDWVFFPPGNVARLSVEAETATMDFRPKVTCATRDYQVIHVLVGTQLGISLLPAMMEVEFDRAKVTTRPLQGSHIGRGIYLAQREDTASPALSFMHKALRRAYRDTNGYSVEPEPAAQVT